VVFQVYPPVPPLAARDCEYACPTVPPANDNVVTVNCAGDTTMLNALVAVAFELSVTCTVKFAVPGAEGVPVIPPPAARVSPAGRSPAVVLHVYALVPPLAARDCEYACPTVPPGNDDVVTVNGASDTAMLNPFSAVAPELSVTCTVKFAVPGADGVPLIVPPDASVSPDGRAPALMPHEYPPVPPLAASVCEYACPAVPPGSEVVVTVSGVTIVMLSALLAVAPPLSVTCAVKLAVPAAVGVPLICPEAARLNPIGSAPDGRLHV
jgi:hypothetical protein